MELVRDLDYTGRLLARSRGFAIATLLTIALGVGGTAAVFSVVYGVLLRPLPYPEPERLVRIWEVHPGGQPPIPGFYVSGPTYRAWSRSSTHLQEIGAFRGSDYTVTFAGEAQRLRGTRVTPSLFRLLRVSPVAGRFFSDADTEAEAAADPGTGAPLVVLGHNFWRERFGGDVAVIGRSLTIDHVPHQIIGVAPPGFAFPEKEVGARDDRREVTLYTPLVVRPRATAKVVDYTEAIGRLAPGTTIAQAEAEGTSYARSVDRPLADLVFGRGHQVDVRVRSLVDQMTMRVRPALLVLLAAVTLVLVIACANVANLFLARGSDRTRELAVRAAIGASRRRLMRQLLTESLAIALLGGALGLFVGWALTAAVPALAPADFPRLDQIHVDAPFLLVACVTTVFVGAVSGITPALRGSRVDLVASMQADVGAGGDGGRSVGTGGTSSARLRSVLLVVEAALAVVLLVGAVLLARSFAELVRVDAGYEPADVLTADVRMPAGRIGFGTGTATGTGTGADTEARTSQFAVALVERLRAMPGVRAAGAGDMAPFGDVLSAFGFALPGTIGVDGRPMIATALRAIITPGYAEALGMRLKAGRLFDASDTTSAIRPMLVNESFANTYLADGRPIVGRRFTGLFPAWLGKDTPVEIVGIVQDMLPAALDARPQPQIFVAQGAAARIGHVTLVVKTNADPAAIKAIEAAVRDTVRELAPAATIERLGPLSAKMSASVGEPRFATLTVVMFALLALTLAATGLYGVLSYNVAQRRRELAVRTALGATRRDLLTMVLREGLTMTTLGLTIGLMLSAATTHAIASVLFGVTPLDAVAFTIAPCLLLLVACTACLLPARRATAINPAEALKNG